MWGHVLSLVRCKFVITVLVGDVLEVRTHVRDSSIHLFPDVHFVDRHDGINFLGLLYILLDIYVMISVVHFVVYHDPVELIFLPYRVSHNKFGQTSVTLLIIII